MNMENSIWIVSIGETKYHVYIDEHLESHLFLGSIITSIDLIGWTTLHTQVVWPTSAPHNKYTGNQVKYGETNSLGSKYTSIYYINSKPIAQEMRDWLRWVHVGPMV